MIHVACIEDNPQYLTTLSIIMQLNSELKVIHKLESCETMIPLFEVEKPDVVIMDIDLPGISGIKGVWELKQRWPEIKVLMLTVFEDEDKIFGAIKAGANGYLLKKDSPQKILDSIFSIHLGEAPMNGMIAAKMLDYFQQHSRKSDLDEYHLTSREKEILQLLVNGLSYKEIAATCYISNETLNSHIKNFYRKLNVHSRSEIAARFGGRFH